MKVVIETKHLIASPGYEYPKQCPLALALEEQHPDAYISVCMGYIGIDHESYEYDGKLWNGNTKNNKVEGVDEMIKLAKKGKFTLKPVEINYERIS